jgi:hypothetical protein
MYSIRFIALHLLALFLPWSITGSLTQMPSLAMLKLSLTGLKQCLHPQGPV